MEKGVQRLDNWLLGVAKNRRYRQIGARHIPDWRGKWGVGLKQTKKLLTNKKPI